METKSASGDDSERENEQAADERDEKDTDEKKADEEDRDQDVKPVAKKVGEKPDTVRRRGEWFRRRTGGSGPPPKGP